MTEHYFWERVADPTKKREENEPALVKFKGTLRDTRLAQENWLCGEIADIANGAKHAKAKFFELRDDQAPGTCGIMRCGFPLSSEPYVFTDSDYTWLLYQLTEYVAEMWKSQLGIS